MTRKTRRWDALAVALARGSSVTKAAKEAGYSTRQAFRLLSDPSFRREVSTLRGRLVDRAVGLLASTNTAAVQTLRRLLADSTPGVRLRSAKAVLEIGARMRENADLVERIEALENQKKQEVKR
jgi:phage terminase small subunit